MFFRPHFIWSGFLLILGKNTLRSRSIQTLILISFSFFNVSVSAKSPEEFQLKNFDLKDLNHDGHLNLEEFSGGPMLFTKLDKDPNDFISRKEFISNPITTKERTRPLVIPPNIKVIVDIEYIEGGGKEQSLDILQPLKPIHQSMSVIVFIHGGAYQGGDKHDGWEYLLPLVDKDFIGVSINYRLSQQAVFPAQIEDCKSAIRYLRAHADKYNLDPKRIGIWGVSAGGHLAALLGTSSGIEELENGPWQGYSSEVQAVCDWFGPVNFLSFGTQSKRQNHNSPESKLFGGPIAEKKALANMASPLKYIDSNDPPFLVMHGTDDKIIPYEQSRLLVTALTEARVPVTFISLNGAGHGSEEFESIEIQLRVLDFFDSTLRKKERLK